MGRMPMGRDGLSLIEVVVAMLVLTVGLLGLAAGTGWVIGSVERARIETARSAALQTAIEQIRATPFDALVDGEAEDGPYRLTWRELEADTRTRVMEVVVTGPGVVRISAGQPMVSATAADTVRYRVVRR
jgi:prepilin-type N-terminal cleavage/methylation domain-containing protein